MGEGEDDCGEGVVVRVLGLGSLGKGESCGEDCWGKGVVLRELG